MKKTDSSFTLDPVERAYRMQERENYVSSLFHPIYEHEPPPLKWLVQDWIPRGYLVFLAAGPKKGKTCIATSLALAVATGTPFAGFPTEQAGVLWLSQEESPHERRLVLLSHPLAQSSTPLYTCYQHLPIDDSDSLDAIAEWVRSTEAGLIVVDPLHGATSGRSLSDGWQARRTLKALKEFCALKDVTALVLHHTKQSTTANPKPRIAESDQLAAVASMQIVMTSREFPFSFPETTSGNEAQVAARLITLDCEGRGEFANKTVHLLSTGPNDYRPCNTAKALPERGTIQCGHIEREVLKILERGEATAEELFVTIRQSVGSIRNSLTRLRAKGMVTIVRTKGRTNFYGLVANHA